MNFDTWLANQARSHSDANTRAQAAALQKYNGDTSGGFINELFGKLNTGYSQNSLSQIKGNFQNMYAADMAKMQGGGGQQNTDNTTTVGNTGTGGGGGTTRTNYASAEQLAGYDQAISQLEHALGRLDGQLGIANSNLQKQYDTQGNELNSNLNRSQNQYNDNTTSNQQSRTNNINSINNKASRGLRGLLDILSSRGAVGSDTILAGRAVQDLASQERSGAIDTFATNQRTLDTNWNNFKGQIDDERKKLADWLDTNRRSAESQSLSTKQGLLQQIANVRSQKASAQGANGANAARADLNAANNLSARIDELARLNPSYTGKQIDYRPGSLDSYKVGGGATVGVDSGNSVTADPTLTLLNTKGDPDEERKKLGLGF